MNPSKSWPTKKLGEVCEKFSFVKAPIGSRPYIEISDINIENKSIIFKEKKSVEGAVIAPKDSVIVSRVRPTRGAITLLDQKQVVSSAFTILKAKDSEALPKFLFYSIGWSKEFLTYLHRKQKGSNYPSVREKDILNFKIFSPPLKVQHQIVERLDTIRKAQELNDRQIALTEELFQSLLHRELDPEGKNWNIVRVREVVKKIEYGLSVSIPNRLDESGISIISMADIDLEGNINYETARKIKISKKELEKFRLNQGDLLFNWRNSKEYIGKTGLFDNDGNFIFASFLLRVIANNKILPKFLWLILNNHRKKGVFSGKARQAVSQANFNASELKNLVKIPLPPLETQRKIVVKLQTVQDYKKKLLEQKQRLKELFLSCLDKVMKEELVF